MSRLTDLVHFCDELTQRTEIPDFPGANNGLQLENNGEVRRIGASVDAGLDSFRKAVEEGVDFLVVHHGLFWNPPASFSGVLYKKLKFAMDHNLAVYSSHLPLDAHQQIGNNRLLADILHFSPDSWFLPYEGVPIALLTKAPDSRADLKERLLAEFGSGLKALEFGSGKPRTVAILTGSGRSALPHLKAAGTDTLITGELRQEHFTLAQEERLNLYVCGHYATERYGVTALANACSQHFKIPAQFIPSDCPL